MIDEINLKGLECFMAIMETGSATAAAQRLGLSQPAVSQHLAALEARVGLKLFRRKRGKLEATREALALLPEIDRAMQNLERITSIVKSLKSARHNVILIGTSTQSNIGMHFLQAFTSQHQSVQVKLFEGSGELIKKRVLNGEVDCGFIEQPQDQEGLHFTEMTTGSAVCVLKPDHALAGHSVLTINDVAGEPLVLLRSIGHLRGSIDRLFEESQLEMKLSMEVGSNDRACEMVSRGFGIAIVGQRFAEVYCENAELVMVPFSPDIQHSYGLVTNSSVPQSALISEFTDFCIDYAAKARKKARDRDSDA